MANNVNKQQQNQTVQQQPNNSQQKPAAATAAAAAGTTNGALNNAANNAVAKPQANNNGKDANSVPRAPRTSTFLSRTEEEFNFNSYTLQELMVKTSENMDAKFWQKTFKFDVENGPLKGLDTDINTPLDQLKNKKLVYSLMFHYLGRSILCSKKVVDRYKALLNKKLREACGMVDPIKYKAELAKLNSAKLNHTIEEIIAPHNQFGHDVVHKWNQEQITWDQYVAEVSFRETVMINLRQICSKHDLSGSAPGEMFIELMAHLLLDNFCYRRLKNKKETPSAPYLSERSITWVMPLGTEVKVEQKKSLQYTRNDYVLLRGKKDTLHRLSYTDCDRDLDPYLNGGHLKSPLLNEPNDLEYYLKKHPGRQLITDISFQLFCCEVQKNPAALVYMVLVSDLIDMDKLCQREIFWSWDQQHNKDTGRGGYLPCTFEGSATAARYLNLYYSYIFDHWYSYDFSDECEEKIMEIIMNPNSEFNVKRGHKVRFEEMMKREMELLDKYVSAKKERDRKSRHLKTVADLWNYLLMKVDDFYCVFPLGFQFK